MMRMNSAFRALLKSGSMVLVCLAPATQGFSQGWLPPDAQMFEHEGTVVGVMPGGVQMLTERDSAWVVQVLPRGTQVKVTGTAEPAFLRNGLYVKFSGDLDAKGVVQGEIKTLEIATPTGKTPVGIFAIGAEENAKPVSKLEAGAYEIRGKVALYKDGELQVVAGKKITGKVASDAKISVNVQDISFAQKEDTVKVKGYYFDRFKPDPNQFRPGTAVGKEIEITILKPLTAVAKKGPTKPTRPPKGKPPTDAPVGTDDDPFGLNKAAAGDKNKK